MSLASLTRPDLIFTDLQAANRSEVLHELADRLARRGVARNAEEMFRDLWEREQRGASGVFTGPGGGVPIPRSKLAGLKTPLVALGLAPAGINLGAADGRQVVIIPPAITPSEPQTA